MKLPKFFTGLLIGTAIGLIIWYWQKSTSAEEGALAVLDRLAVAEARVRELEGRLRLTLEREQSLKQPEVLSGLSDLWGLNSSVEETTAQEDEMILAVSDESTKNTAAKDDLKVISGIGPTYERRLNESGINSFADLTHHTPEELRAIASIKSWQAALPEEWIAEAERLSES